jgi:hypothetical protein
MSSTANSTSNDNNQAMTKERTMISSILHNEYKCVSISSIAMDTKLSRFDASQVLDSIVSKRQDSIDVVPSVYETTKCVVIEEDSRKFDNYSPDEFGYDNAVPCTGK